MQYKFKKTDLVAILVVSILCAVQLYRELTAESFHYPSLVNSVLGFAGILLFLIKKQEFRKIIYLWIIFQIFAIKRTYLAPDMQGIQDDIWDPAQALGYYLGMYFTTETSKIFIAINILPFVYLIVFRIVSTNSLIGMKFTFTKLKADGITDALFPLSGIIENRVTIGKEKHWLLLTLDHPIEIEAETISYALIKRKNGETLRKGLKQQSVIFKFIKDYKNFELFPESHEDYVNVLWVNSQ